MYNLIGFKNNEALSYAYRPRNLIMALSLTHNDTYCLCVSYEVFRGKEQQPVQRTTIMYSSHCFSNFIFKPFSLINRRHANLCA